MKKFVFAGSVVFSYFASFAGSIQAGDATLTLDDNAGSSSFVVQDSDKTNQFKVNSDGQGYFSGNVGIGTTAPSTKLEIAKDSNTKTLFYPNYYTPAKFDYYDTNGPSTYFSFGYPYTNGIYLNSYFNGADVVSEDTINPHWGILFTGCSACSYPENHFVIRSAPATTGLPTFTDRFVIQGSNGNVGIGTTAPTERLDVAGNIKASGCVNGSAGTVTGGGTCVDIAEFVIEGSNVIISGKENYTFSDDKAPIALKGRVPVKADCDALPIREGDLLVSSKEKGYAQSIKALKPKDAAEILEI
jgi:hypothetical protein